jgi:hypothetical protein
LFVDTAEAKGGFFMAKEQTQTSAQSDRETLKSKATELTQEAKQRGKQQLDTTKKAAADQAQKVADVIERASEELGRNDQQSLARYTGDLATSIKTLADNLSNRGIDELGTDAIKLARQNPTLFLFGSVALGFALSRFVKASADREEKETGEEAPYSLESQGHSQPTMLSETKGDADHDTRYPEIVIPNQVKGE